MDFSLFYFADDGEAAGDRYRLLMEGARFADEHGFAAVWTPERHFHRFGGLFPNPAVTAAAVAATTSRVKVRAGSVVLPLHHPVRVAEEWAVIDNLSRGRAGLALASGWNPQDFLLAPEAYADRRQRTVAAVDTLRRLWRGDPYEAETPLKVYPPPVQSDIPLWLTSSGNVETFEAAGRAGTGLLTNLLTHDMDSLSDKVVKYRRAFADSGRDGRGHVVLMLHACLGDNLPAVEDLVREPLRRYLMSALDLNLRSAGPSASAATPGRQSARERAESWARTTFAPAAVDSAYLRYLTTDGLFGSVSDALAVVDRARRADVDEIACLIDFGIPAEAALHGLNYLDELRAAAQAEHRITKINL
ncbi:MupA/Atu3671 family FMN-dependent luciferase-like monooxygenase [Actinoplanes derwentensis]|uniref:Natural product biosynthesis luciferase-like monooxygenase domain-containing protein n=1 Tax=Actinoplanes derwentensis TaxID=113562 RepID=A0A1H2DDF4_9ACTN|nr:MupA/Atu3671 family FMN-dependent luciferase-like monooxygenase [Actinoplanes derwentensis]GID90140.1 siderophore biosynthesis protein [Actinoplanes derwentensis]SDT80731.1 natural product biosynthesis luciferase-like monooxygenase domain-containing protein [Actinoplanes derwentensis]